MTDDFESPEAPPSPEFLSLFAPAPDGWLPTLVPGLFENPENAQELCFAPMGIRMARLQPDRPAAELAQHRAVGSLFHGGELGPADIAGIADRFCARVAGDLHQFEHSYALLPSEVLDALARFLGQRKTLDAGAGLGTLGRLLNGRGARVITADLGTWFPPMLPAHLDVVGDAVGLLPGDFEVVIMVWPPHGKPFAARVAKAMRPGQVLVYQGEWNGCTANPAFFKELSSPRWREDHAASRTINQHNLHLVGMHDHWSVFEKVA